MLDWLFACWKQHFMIMVHYKLIANAFSQRKWPKNVNHDDWFVCEKGGIRNGERKKKNLFWLFMLFILPWYNGTGCLGAKQFTYLLCCLSLCVSCSPCGLCCLVAICQWVCLCLFQCLSMPTCLSVWVSLHWSISLRVCLGICLSVWVLHTRTHARTYTCARPHITHARTHSRTHAPT